MTVKDSAAIRFIKPIEIRPRPAGFDGRRWRAFLGKFGVNVNDFRAPMLRALHAANGKRDVANVVTASFHRGEHRGEILSRTSKAFATAPNEERSKAINRDQFRHLLFSDEATKATRSDKELQFVHFFEALNCFSAAGQRLT